MLSSEAFLNAFVTLLVTIDPPGLAAMFIGLTAGMSRSERVETALRACVIALGILIVFSLGGQAIFDVLGITLGAFRVAGGFLLFWIAFEMIFEKRQERHEKTARRAITNDMVRNIAAFPLALPLIAGPGAISATILLSASFSTTTGMAILMGILVAVIAITFLALVLGEQLNRVLGETGRTILTRLLGVILSALAVQFVADGAAALIATHQT